MERIKISGERKIRQKKKFGRKETEIRIDMDLNFGRKKMNE